MNQLKATPLRQYNAYGLPERKLEAPFVTFLKKIWNAVKSVFVKIGGFFKNLFHKDKLKLTADEIEIIQTAVYRAPVPASPQPTIPLDGARISPQSSPLVPKEKMEQLPPIKDPLMQQFHQTAQGLVENAMNAVFEEKIEGSISDVKKGLQFTSTILKTAANLGIKAGIPLIETLSLDKMLEEEHKNLLNWLLENGVKETFPDMLKRALAEEMAAEEIDRFTGPCIKWLLDSDRTTHPSSFYEPQTAKEFKERIEKIYEKAYTLLFHCRIEQFIESCREKLEVKLPEIIRAGLLDNSRTISDLLLRRFIALAEQSNFPKMFDSLIETSLSHTEAVLHVETVKKQADKKGRDEIKKAREARNAEPKDSKEIENKEKLLKFLEDLKERGVKKHPDLSNDEELITAGGEEWLLEYSQNEGRKAFASFVSRNEQFCHSGLAKIVNRPDMDPKEKDKIEEKMFDEFAEEVIALLLPRQSIEYKGKVEKVDGLIFLISQIEIPLPFKEIAKDGLKIAGQILSEPTKKKVGEAYEKAWEAIGDWLQDLVADEVKKLAHKGIVMAAKRLFSQFITPVLINDLSASQLFPLIQHQILVSFGTTAMENETTRFAEMFHRLMKPDADREAVLREIRNALREKVQENCVFYREEFTKITNEKFAEIFHMELIAIEAGIAAHQAGGDATVESTAKGMKGRFAKPDVVENKLLGQLFYNLVFEIGGGLGTVKNLFASFAKDPISKVLTQSLHRMRKSPTHLFFLMTEKLKLANMDKEYFKKKLFTEPQLPDAEMTEAALKEEISKTSKAVCDIAAASHKIAKFAVKGELETIEGLINNIYQKVLGDRVMVHNLILRVQAAVTRALTDASLKVNGFTGDGPIKVAKPPMLLPPLFDAE